MVAKHSIVCYYFDIGELLFQKSIECTHKERR